MIQVVTKTTFRSYYRRASGMPTHQIRNPLHLDTVQAFRIGDAVYIEADGRPDLGAPSVRIVEVYGKVFPRSSKVPQSGDATLQGDLQDLIDKRPTNGCVAGSPINTAAGISYRFRAADGNAIPIYRINTDQNFLQVWVRFEGNDPYVLSTTYV